MPPAALASLLLGAGRFAMAVVVTHWRRRAPHLPAPVACPATDPVTVLLPVRDEADNVLPCLDSLLAQTSQPAIRVIDDGSSDRTAELVAERAAAQPRLTLLTAGPLPPGWRGKVHALSAGSQGVVSPWLLLTDADTRHHPELLARALAAARPAAPSATPSAAPLPPREGAPTGGLAAVSLAGSQEAAGWGENLLVPAVFGLLDALLGDWRQAARGNGPPVANGQFLLLCRAAWETCGGFAAVRAEPGDDVAMARLLAAHGFRTGFFRAPGLLRVRMYRGWAAAAAGWRRNLGALLGPRPRAALLAVAMLLLPAVAGGACLVSGKLLAATLLWSTGAAGSALLRAGSEHSPGYALLYPLDDLLLAWLLARGVLDYRRGRLMPWKGREMKL